MSDPKKHHFIPEAFLEPWCSGGRLTCFAIKHGHLCIDRYSPAQVARQPCLYSLHGVSPGQAQSIETKLLQSIDNAAALVHKMWLNDTHPKLTVKQREDWGRFVLSLRVRTPHMINVLREKGREAVMDDFLRNPDEFEAIKGSLHHSSLPDLVQEKAQVLVDNFGLTNVFPQLLLESEILPDFLSLYWQALEFRRNRYSLLLADNPVFIHGHKNDGWLWALPISPSRVFVAASRPLNRRRDPVKEANISSIRQATTYIYASGSEAQRFIERNWTPAPLNV
jgi:Protein of unknown function (DUF4238)